MTFSIVFLLGAAGGGGPLFRSFQKFKELRIGSCDCQLLQKYSGISWHFSNYQAFVLACVFVSQRAPLAVYQLVPTSLVLVQEK